MLVTSISVQTTSQCFFECETPNVGTAGGNEYVNIYIGTHRSLKAPQNRNRGHNSESMGHSNATDRVLPNCFLIRPEEQVGPDMRLGPKCNWMEQTSRNCIRLQGRDGMQWGVWDPLRGSQTLLPSPLSFPCKAALESARTEGAFWPLLHRCLAADSASIKEP